MSRTRSKPVVRAAHVPKQPPHARKPRLQLWICAALLAATLAAYAPVRNFGFVNFDDPDFVSANPHVRQGLSAGGIRWAFLSVEAANWFPVTRLSHLLDYQLFGLDSGRQHAENVLLHSLAAIVLFLFLLRATRAAGPSALVAFLFAVHPLHVESVAWISERKDVLCALFWFLALWSYIRYTERRTRGRYLAVTGWFALGLLSKPMIVTLPFVLLLLDFWPLRRSLKPALLREKIPWFALSALASVVTYLVQHRSGAVEALSAIPISLRVENALLAYCIYIGKLFWPSGLAVFYPYPATIVWWQALAAACVLAAITAAAWMARTHAPYLAMGWLWYVGTLFPVIGIVQVGGQARADRYTYVPMIGLTIALVWGASELLRRWPRLSMPLGVACVLACVPATRAQAAYWQNSGTLFRRALAVTTANDVAEHNLGNYLMSVPGRLPEAIAHLEASVSLYPASAKAHTDLGTALSRVPGSLPEAVNEFRIAIRLAPNSPVPHTGLGSVLAGMGRLQEAIEEDRMAIRLAPESAIPRNNLGNALAKLGRMPEAIEEYRAALRIDPDDAEAHNNLGIALAGLPGRLSEAIEELRTVVRLNPDSAEAHKNLGIALGQDPARLAEAMAEFEVSLRLKPDADLQRAVDRYRAGAR